MTHEQYMQRCLDLAAMAYPACRPNPMVGALVVHEGKIVGEGYTQSYGGAHAEVMALRGLSDEVLRQATLYVSLEPCAHHGQTPPCVDLIVEKQIPRVVVACSDPFEEVDGRGISRLKAVGIDVVEGVLSAEAHALNKRFFVYHLKKRPHVTLKWAETSDGFIDRHASEGERVIISGALIGQLVHRWRSEEQAILIGAGTAHRDNPSLTTRLVEGVDPERFVWASSPIDDGLTLSQSGYTWLQADGPEMVLDTLYKRGVQSVLVEGGRQVLQSFLGAGCYDEVRRIIAPGELREGVDAPVLSGEPSTEQQIGDDRLMCYVNSL